MDSSLQKLGKVLALADSAHEGEALAALRTARALLRESGMDFADMINDHFSEKLGAPTPLEALYLRSQVQGIMRENARLQKELENARGALAQSQAERERWEKIAKDATDRLWLIAKTLGEGE